MKSKSVILLEKYKLNEDAFKEATPIKGEDERLVGVRIDTDVDGKYYEVFTCDKSGVTIHSEKFRTEDIALDKFEQIKAGK